MKKMIRSSFSVHANRLFSRGFSNSFRKNTEKYRQFAFDHGIKSIKDIAGAFALLGVFGLTAYSYYMSSGLTLLVRITGKPAPDALKNPDDPKRLVWSRDSVIDGGPGDGSEGRSCPNEVSVVQYDKTMAWLL